MKKEEIRNIPKKNYIILGIIIIVTMIIVNYFYMWYQVYEESKLNKPIMNKYMQVINLNELDDYLVENPNTIIYVSVLENKNIREFEKLFKRELKKKNIKREMLYLDITNDIKDEEKMKSVKKKYSIDSVSIEDVPVVIVVDNGKLSQIYSISQNNYDIKNFENFINSIIFTEEDLING